MRPLQLPHGLYDADGACHRDVVLRPLLGVDEVRLAGIAVGPAWVDEVVAASVERLGGYDGIEVDTAAALTRGDRQFLLLRLWALQQGDDAVVVVRCPNPACRKKADLDVRMSSLAPEGTAAPRPDFLVQTSAGAFRLREPTGADDAAVVAPTRPDRADGLWARLVVDAAGAGPVDIVGWRALPATVRREIALGFAAEARIPDLRFVSRCPSCAALLELGLDPATLLARRLQLGADRVHVEVHVLAWHYHWSQADILALTRDERWRYLELIKRQLEGRPLQDREG